MRLGLEIVQEVRSVWKENKPLFFRISSVDGDRNGSTIEENVEYCKALKEHGEPCIDVENLRNLVAYEVTEDNFDIISPYTLEGALQGSTVHQRK